MMTQNLVTVNNSQMMHVVFIILQCYATKLHKNLHSYNNID